MSATKHLQKHRISIIIITTAPADGLTVIMVTHDLDTVVELSTQVAVLADKRVVAYAPLAEVVQVPHPFIEQYFHGTRGERALTALGSANAAAVD